jgi:hypothetical protein
MERSSKRGKIPQQDWPSIIKRYEAGETLASIARTYDCSPPAISYILSRSRALDATLDGAEQSGIDPQEPRLVKGHPNDMLAGEFINGAPEIGDAAALPPTRHASSTMDGTIPDPVAAGPGSTSNGTAGVSEIGAEITVTETSGRPAEREPAHAALSGTGNTPGSPGTAGPQPQPAEPRRTLHLSLSHNNAQPMETPQHDGRAADMADGSAVRSVGGQQQGLTQHSAPYHPAPDPAASNGGAGRSTAESHKRDGSVFIDRALRERVDSDISAFLTAFDAALAEDTVESRADLREATDRLLRAGARTRIELERLEARMPLSARDPSGYAAPGWRPR